MFSRAIASKCGRWYNRGKSIRQGGEEEEDGRDHPTRTFCDVGRSSSRTDETTSVAGHHRHRFVCGDLRSRHVAEHSNEKTALPFLLKQLELAGCIVSIDAMGCHAKIGKQIKEQDGEYVLALKANQGTLYQDVVDLFADALTPQGADLLHDYHPTQDTGHGRVERRQYWTIADPEVIAYLNVKEAWPGLRSVGMVEAER